jgi:hypothetical protein
MNVHSRAESTTNDEKQSSATDHLEGKDLRLKFWLIASLLQKEDFRSKSRHAKNFTAGI